VLHEHGAALLCACFEHSNVAMAQRLVRAGVNVGVPLGEMPEEAARQLARVVRSTFQLRAETVLADLLWAASVGGCVELQLWLLDRGLPQSALHGALSADEAYDPACLERLLAADAAVPAAVLSRALEVACKRSSPEAVRVLLRRGATWTSVEHAKKVVESMARTYPPRPVGVWLELLAGGAVSLELLATTAVPLLTSRSDKSIVRSLLARGVPVQLELSLSNDFGEPVDASADAEWAADILHDSNFASLVIHVLTRSGGVASFLRLRGWGLWPHLAQFLHRFVERESAAETLLLLAAGADPLALAKAGSSSAYALMCTPITSTWRRRGEVYSRQRFSGAKRDAILLAMAGVMRWRRRRWPVVAWSLWGEGRRVDSAAAAAAAAEDGGGVGHKRRERPDGGGGGEEWEGEGPPAAKRAPPASGDGE
jgi:hypothetical protein